MGKSAIKETKAEIYKRIERLDENDARLRGSGQEDPLGHGSGGYSLPLNTLFPVGRGGFNRPLYKGRLYSFGWNLQMTLQKLSMADALIQRSVPDIMHTALNYH